jgi:hypothetical protein
MPLDEHKTTYVPGKGITSIEAKKKTEDEALAVQKKQQQNIGSLAPTTGPGKGPMPVQKPGESASSFGARMRRWRAGEPEPDDGKGAAVKGMLAEKRGAY